MLRLRVLGLMCMALASACAAPAPTRPPSQPAIIAETHAGATPAPITPRPVDTPQQSASELPIFDTHLHYSIGAWADYTPAQIANKMTRANVIGALVSSSPDDGTIMLMTNDPKRALPVLRPYHGDVNSGNWADDLQIIAYLEQRLQARDYLGIGEFHVSTLALAEGSVVRRVVQMATERDMFVQVHGNAEVIRAILRHQPQARVFWAHMGMSDSAQTVMALLDDFPNVWTDTSYRDGEIAPGDALDPAWRATLVKHAERILVGSDTWVPSRWDSYEQIIASHRIYLNLLPRDVAEKIAWRNAARMFGVR